MRDIERRITVVITDGGAAEKTTAARDDVAVYNSADALRLAVPAALSDDALDIERVVIDRVGTPLQVLDFLASIPQQFLGDVLVIQRDGGAFLSSTVRGGGRTLHSVRSSDVHFYLQAHELTV